MTTSELDPSGATPAPTGADAPMAEVYLHAVDAHHAAGGHQDAHSTDHAAQPVGPIDWGAWLVGAIGVGAGSVIAIVLAAAIQHG